MKKPTIIALDLESILVPEIWPTIAKETDIKELSVTSREFPDFNELTKRRLRILRERGLVVDDIRAIVDQLHPLDGASKFLTELRGSYEATILSGGLDKFIKPLVGKLGYPFVFSYFLDVDSSGGAVDFQPLKKTDVTEAFKELGFNVVAVGDSYNDIGMLEIADVGILFNASKKLAAEYPQFPTCDTYESLRDYIETAINGRKVSKQRSSQVYPVQKQSS